IGGDKNLDQAQKNWPDELMAFKFNQLSENQINQLLLILLKNKANIVVIPYFNTLWSAHNWPCGQIPKDPLNHYHCLQETKNKFSPIVEKLKKFNYLLVTNNELYATVQLKPEFSDFNNKLILSNELTQKMAMAIHYPILIKNSDPNMFFILRK